MRCLSYTCHTGQSYVNEVSFLYLTHSPFLWQWGVIPILDTQPSLMSMRCPSYTWHTAQFYDNEVSFLYLTLRPHSYDNEVSFLYLTLSSVLWQWSVIPILDTQPPFLWQWGVIPIFDTQLSLMTMKCHSYTWHSAQSYDNEVSFLYLTHSQSYNNDLSFLYLTLSLSLITTMCHSYTWHSAHSHDNEVSFLSLTLNPILKTWQWIVIVILDTQSNLNTFACKIWRNLVLRNIKVLKKKMKVCPLEPMLNFGHPQFP
jgi:hypothetical protein